MIKHTQMSQRNNDAVFELFISYKIFSDKEFVGFKV